MLLIILFISMSLMHNAYSPLSFLDVGETVLIAPQCLARIVSLPQPGIALVLMEMIPVNGAMSSKTKSFEEHYAYIDTRELDWDFGKAYWKPKGTCGNRYADAIHILI